MTYVMGAKSREILAGVHPDLQAVVERAIELTTQDFTVFEGLRTKERQRQLVDAGRSQTMNSRHIGGYAVDLVPYIGGRVVWDNRACYNIARAMKQAAAELNVVIRWGGSWQRLHEIKDPERAVSAYVQRKQAADEMPFIDAVHFELPAGETRPIERKPLVQSRTLRAAATATAAGATAAVEPVTTAIKDVTDAVTAGTPLITAVTDHGWPVAAAIASIVVIVCVGVMIYTYLDRRKQGLEGR